MKFPPFRIVAMAIAASVLSSRAELAADASLYKSVIHPLMDAHCISCHGPDKQKGKLRMDTPEAYKAGGKSGKALITAGKAAESEIFVRIALPHDHEDVMPPDDKEKLSKEQIDLVKWWIEGAAGSFEVKIGDAKIPDALKAVAEAASKLKGSGAKGESKVVAPSKPVSIDDLLPKMDPIKKLGAIALPIAQNTRSLMVEFHLLGDAVGDEQLALLEPIKGELEWLNLGRTKVTDGGLAKLAGLSNLKRLYLDRTSIGDGGTAQLKGLKNLEYLNLYGSKVSDASVESLKQLSGLKKLYLWQTGFTSTGVQALRAALPNTYIDDGWGPEDDAKAKAEEKPAEPAKPAETAAAKADEGSCCDKAAKAGKACEHPCCVEAVKAGKICEKCNPKAAAAAAAAPAKPAETAKKFDDGSCCDKAAKGGKTCDHPCCVEAAKAGKVCEKCNPKTKPA